MATDTARTTEKSYWRKSREGETKQVKFKTLFEYMMNDEAEVTCSGSVFQIGNVAENTPF